MAIFYIKYALCSFLFELFCACVVCWLCFDTFLWLSMLRALHEERIQKKKKKNSPSENRNGILLFGTTLQKFADTHLNVQNIDARIPFTSTTICDFCEPLLLLYPSLSLYLSRAPARPKDQNLLRSQHMKMQHKMK